MLKGGSNAEGGAETLLFAALSVKALDSTKRILQLLYQALLLMLLGMTWEAMLL